MASDPTPCATCGAPLPAPSGLSLFFRGQRWNFCSAPCRLAFKCDPERHAAARPEAGRAPHEDAPTQPAPPPRLGRPTPFSALIARAAPSRAAKPPETKDGEQS